jgi:two-component system, cell cycle response regulator
MLQDKIYSVSTLGLSNNEVRFIKIMLALTSHASTYREQGRYEWFDDAGKANVAIVNADDEAAMQTWHILAENKPAPILLLLTATEQVPFTKYHFSRPYGPSKVLMWLDKIVKDWREFVPEVKIFSSAAKSAHREYFQPGQNMTSARHRALVVDDSATVRKQLVLELGCFNIQVDTAETGEQGLGKIAKNRYDIIFLDVVMPGADGYQVCKSIRKIQATKRTPIIMLTSKSSQFDRVRGSLAGCSTYLTKPVDYENFYQVLEGYLAATKENMAKNNTFCLSL